MSSDVPNLLFYLKSLLIEANFCRVLDRAFRGSIIEEDCCE